MGKMKNDLGGDKEDEKKPRKGKRSEACGKGVLITLSASLGFP